MALSIKLLMIGMVLVIVTASLPILHIYASTNTSGVSRPVSDSLGDIIESVALLVGVIAPLIVAGLAYVKAKSQDPKIREAADTGIYVGQLATATANKALENKQNIKELIDYSLKVAPEDATKFLEERQALIDKLSKEISATQAQIKRITPMIPGIANADTIANLPRENNF